ncbi:MAG TPA: T9SS type A sorting domain-containing protein, partial [Bacteroidia bacterium]
ISSTITGISIPNGSQFFIRWVDADITGSEDGLAIEDLWVTPQLAPVLPTLSVTDVTMNEGNSGTTTFDFTVDLSAPAGAGGVTFDIQTADGTALISDADYVTNSLTGQTIPAGSSSYTFSVLVNGDVTPEANDTFYVNVTNVTGATVTDAQGMGIITDDDTTPPLVTGEPSDETVCAGDLAIFSAQATGAPTPTVQWQVSTDGGANWSDVSGATATTYSFNPASSQDGNMYWAIFTNGGGVDTTAAVTLTVNPTYSISETFAVCSGSNYTFPDGSTTTNITSTVVHLSSFTTSLGCDSNIVTTINVNPLYNLNQNANVCSGSNFQFPDGTMANNVTSTVSHTSNLTSVITGCDSIINTTVNVTPIDTTSLAQSICSGTVYDFFGTNLSAAGIYYHTLTNMAGCDSIIELDLSLDMVPVAGFTSSIDVDTVDFTNTSTGAFSYLWDLSDGNGFSFTGMNATHIYPANASYTVCLIATSIQGCADTVCDVIQIQNISLKDQYVKASFEVYPNPAKEQVTIAFGTEVKAATVKVINALGKTILTKDIRNAADAKINLNTIDGGVYFIQVDINGERMLKRLIVE